jgi:hypothetical protein
MRQEGKQPSLVLISPSWRLEDLLQIGESSPEREPPPREWGLESGPARWFLGLRGGTPVVEWPGIPRETILVVDLGAFAEWTQYQVGNTFLELAVEEQPLPDISSDASQRPTVDVAVSVRETVVIEVGDALAAQKIGIPQEQQVTD